MSTSLNPAPSCAITTGAQGSCDLTKPAATDLVGAESVEEMAVREAWTPETYSIALSEAIRSSEVPLDMQRERLSQLAALGAQADRISAKELARHFTILEALFQRFSHQAVEVMKQGGSRCGEVSERYLSGALKAQRSAMSCLSALAVLREGQQRAPTKSTTPTGAE